MITESGGTVSACGDGVELGGSLHYPKPPPWAKQCRFVIKDDGVVIEFMGAGMKEVYPLMEAKPVDRCVWGAVTPGRRFRFEPINPIVTGSEMIKSFKKFFEYLRQRDGITP